MTLVKACLNGARSRADHGGLPLTPAELARDAAAVAAAGAGAVHVHARDASGQESLDPGPCAAAVAAIRAAASGLPVGLTTGGWIEPVVDRRLALLAGWTFGPDFASVNFSEDGADEACEVLAGLGIGIEAGLVDASDAERAVASGWAGRSVRILFEPQEQEVDQALDTAARMGAVLDAAGVEVPRLLHGFDLTAWPLLEAALAQGLDVRIGLEDALTMPDGSPAAGNAALVSEAVRRAG